MVEAQADNKQDVPRLLVLSSLFPSDEQPAAGVFIRERMFRVGRHRKIVVLAPQAWFPGQSLVRWFRPHFRPLAKACEQMSGVEVHRPRYLSVPGFFKRMDGMSMALCSWWRARRLAKEYRLNLLDVHFGYPDGRAGVFLARRLGLPMVLTLRGKERRESQSELKAPLATAVTWADRVITVSNALRAVAIELGADPNRVSVIGNGIDAEKFTPIARSEARNRLGLGQDWNVLVSVGTLVERKGFQRVIEVLPALLRIFPKLHFLIVGGSGPEGDDSARFKALVGELGLTEQVHFLGPRPSDQLFEPLSAADVFVLASSYEGWANVLLESMACGLPVIATDVGGNGQVICDPKLGRVVPFGDSEALKEALAKALATQWDSAAIREYALANTWDRRIPILIDIFDTVVRKRQETGRTRGMDARTGDQRAG